MPADDQKRQDHAHRLRPDGGDGGARHVHIQHRHQHKVAHDVDHAGDAHEQKRQPRVAQAAEDAADQVVEHYEYASHAADADVLRRQLHRLGRRLHQHRDLLRKDDQRHRQHRRYHQEKRYRPPDQPADALVLPLTQVAADENHHTRRQLAEDKGDQVHDAAARGYARYARVGAEMAHHQHVHGAVHGLQDLCPQYGNHKLHHLAKDAAAGKILLGVHDASPPYLFCLRTILNPVIIIESIGGTP